MFGVKGEIKKEVKKKTRPKSVSVKLLPPKKRFSSPEEVTNYYKMEGEKVKIALRDFKLKQTGLQLQLARQEYMKVVSQKNDLDELGKDLLSHKKEIEEKVKVLKRKKENEEVHKRAVDDFIKKIKKLEKEARKIMDVRENLMDNQKELVSKMKKLARESSNKFRATDLPTSEDLFKFESSKEQILAKAKMLLSDEMKEMLSDSSLLKSIDASTTRKLRDLNLKIISVNNNKNDVLKKLELLEMNEEKAVKELKRAEGRVKKLEDNYKKLLKR